MSYPRTGSPYAIRKPGTPGIPVSQLYASKDPKDPWKDAWREWLPKELKDLKQEDLSKIWVINPMHIVTLSEENKSKFVKVVEACKRFSEKWFSHVLLLLFLILYACLGAYIFQALEGNTEVVLKVRKSIRNNV